MKARLKIALILSAVLLTPVVGQARWSAEPVTVHATMDGCPLVAAASDAQDGAIVVWHESDALGPHLKAQHLLANGDLDDRWPAAGVLVSSATVARAGLAAVGDDNGGAYVWWLEGAGLYLTRLTSDGAIAPGWPARGKSLGSVFLSTSRPLAFADGEGGIWLGWCALDPSHPTSAGRIAHVGPDGLGAGGWPDSARLFASSGAITLWTLTFSFAPAGDGGAWMAWGDASYDYATDTFGAGQWRLLRTTGTGETAPGWTASGLVLGIFHGEWLRGGWGWPFVAQSAVAVAPDGTDGVYLLRLEVTSAESSTPKLYHLDSTGNPVLSWPASGVTPFALGLGLNYDYPAECSLRLFPEVGGGVFTLRPSYYSESGVDLNLSRVTPTGTQTWWCQAMSHGIGSFPAGFECTVSPAGDTYFASYEPCSPYVKYATPAFLELDQVYASGGSGPGCYEVHPEPVTCWYGDIGLAPTSDAGAIFVWSQSHER
jgi:hypothetical protein